MMNNKVCIIITAYNAEEYIEQCISNLSLQTYNNYELVIVDNGSTDDTRLLIKSFQESDDRIRLLHVETNVGVGDGRNSGLKWALNNCDSDYLFFLDIDDWLHPQCLEIMVETILKDGSDMVFEKHALSHEYNNEFTPIHKYVHKRFEDMESFWCDTIKTLAFVTGRLIKKELFRDIMFPQTGLDDERTTYKLVFSANAVSILDKSLYYWYQNPTSYMHHQWSPDKLQDQIESVLEPLDFSYQNGYKRMFSIYIKRYIELVTGRIMIYGWKKRYRSIYVEQYKRLRSFPNNYNDFCKRNEIENSFFSGVSNSVVKYIRGIQDETEKQLRNNNLIISMLVFILKNLKTTFLWGSIEKDIKKWLE